MKQTGVTSLGISLALFAGCELILGPTAPPRIAEPNVEALPGPGRVLVVGEPLEAQAPVVITLVLPDNSPSSVVDEIATGGEIRVSKWSNPGRHRLLANDHLCTGEFPIASDMETRVRLRLDPAGCAVIVTGISPL